MFAARWHSSIVLRIVRLVQEFAGSRITYICETDVVVDLLLSVANQIEGRTICAFGEAAAWPTQSFIAKFRDHFENKAKNPERKKSSLQLI